jgi:hypothetical protein
MAVKLNGWSLDYRCMSFGDMRFYVLLFFLNDCGRVAEWCREGILS